MVWGNALRRWTMHSIHAAILGSALFGSASIATAQPAGTAASKLPGIHYTRSQTFNLPVVMDDNDRQGLSEIRLYVKTANSGWALQERGASSLKHFSCKVAQDGEYWYTLALVDRQGQMSPADVNLVPPSQRVVVDTTVPAIQVQPWNSEGDFCLRCTVQDANPDHGSLKAVCRTESGDLPLEIVPNQPGVFRVRGAELMRFPVMVSAKDMAGNVGTKEVNIRELIGTTLNPAPKVPTPLPPPTIAQTEGGVDTKSFAALPAPRVSDSLPRPENLNTHPAPPSLPPQGPIAPPAVQDPAPRPPVAPLDPPHHGAGPHQLINTTQASVDFRIDQVGPSGVGKVEIYMTPDRGLTWHPLREAADKRSPTDIKLPGDGVYGIRVVVTNGNGFGGRTPLKGDQPHCTIEVDTTAPFVQLRSAEVLPSSGQVELKWNATDKNLGSEPVSLFYRTRTDGPWQVIAKGVKNDGLHRWAFPRDAGGQFFFKVEVTDQAGNMSQAASSQPVLIDMTEPRATVLGVTGAGVGRPGN